MAVDEFQHVRSNAFQLGSVTEETSRTRYTQAQINLVPPLDDPILRGQAWTVKLRDKDFTYNVLVDDNNPSDKRTTIGVNELTTKLAAVIAADSAFDDGGQVTVNGSTITVHDMNGISAEINASDGTLWVCSISMVVTL